MLRVERFSSFTFGSGHVLPDVPVAFHAWGRLNQRGDNAVLVCHSLTSSTDVADWWPGLLGPGRALDTEKYFVVCANVIGSPYGTVSPVTLSPETGRRYGGSFPVPTIRDTVMLYRALLERIGVRQLAWVIGGSLGGMQALEWSMQGTSFGRSSRLVWAGATLPGASPGVRPNGRQSIGIPDGKAGTTARAMLPWTGWRLLA